jgi:hypothetical protein
MASASWASGPAHDVDERALADRDPEHLAHQPGQTLGADGLGDVQVDDQGAQAWPEQPAGLQPGRHRGRDARAAARAGAMMPIDPGDDRLERRQFGVVIGVDGGLIGRRRRLPAVRAGVRHGLDGVIRMLGQRARRSRTSLAPLGRLGRPVALPALRRRQG